MNIHSDITLLKFVPNDFAFNSDSVFLKVSRAKHHFNIPEIQRVADNFLPTLSGTDRT